MADAPQSPTTATVQVWDRFVRVFHWSLVVGFIITYTTEHDLMTLHVWAGYIIGALIALRVVWGVIGPRHARFTDFIYRPSRVIAYLRDLRSFRAKRYLGHSPAGGAMIIVLLVVLAVTVATGIAADNRTAVEGDEAAAPVAGLALAALDGDEGAGGEERGEGGGGFVGAVHQLLADIAMVLIVLHVAGVGWTSLAHRENLVRAMITGRKRV